MARQSLAETSPFGCWCLSNLQCSRFTPRSSNRSAGSRIRPDKVIPASPTEIACPALS